MAATEDELARKRVQEAVWTWTGRILVLAVVFGFGVFAGWYLWARGVQGAPALRAQVVAQQDQILELKNNRVDIEGKLTVTQGRLSDCQKALEKAKAPAGATP